jgi:cbb3-type cytochrome oxidase subunit 3
MMGFLMIYTLLIAYVFRPGQRGRRRRRWLFHDYIWVPLGGMTGVFLLALWWRMHGPT